MRASSAGVVGTRRDFDREANRYGFRVGLWTDSAEMDLVYHSRMWVPRGTRTRSPRCGWARRTGSGQVPDRLFHVYSPEGDLLFECALEGPAPADGDLRFSIDADGFLSIQSDPLDFPRVYILSLQEE